MNFIFISVVLGQIAIVLPVFESIAIDTIMNTFLKTSRLLINSTVSNQFNKNKLFFKLINNYSFSTNKKLVESSLHCFGQ